jgi:asparagine synthase (glutamine-hydrolysing)
VKIRKFWKRQPNSKFRWQLFRRLYSYLPQFSDQRYAPVAIQSFKTELTSESPFYSHLIRWSNNAANKVYFSNRVKKDLEGYNAYEDLKTYLPKEYFKVNLIDQAQYLDFITLLRGYLLSSQGDRMSMAHSVEGRYPFLDHEFVEYASTIPEEYKLRHLKDKLILRRAAAKFLPEEICSRPKVAYQAPEIRPFISKEGKVSDLVGQYLSEARIKEFDLFDGGVVNTLLKKIQGSDQSRLGMRDNMAFVQVLSTQIFTDLFLKSSFRNKAQEQLRANKIPFTKRLQSSAAVLNKR